jgi:lysophospholipase L1-like esterase
MGKQNLYEHSMKAPLIFSGPGIPRGQSDALAYLLDIFPTACELAGVPIPAGLDGKSLAPVIRGERAKVRDSLFTAYRTVQRAVRDDRWKLIRYPHINRTQLFDLQSDPDELHNLADEPAHAGRVKQLLTLMQTWQKQLGDTTPLTAEKPSDPKFTPPVDESAKKDDFAKWESAIAAFEKQDVAAPPSKGAVLFVGSSSIRLWKLADSFGQLDVINRGFGGSHLADSVHFLDRLVLKHEPRTVVLYAGDNDIASGKTPERVAGDFQAFAKSLHAKLPKTRVVYICIKPSIKRWALVDKIRAANKLIADACAQDERLTYLDVFPPMLGDDGRPRPELFVEDGLHLSAKGYAVWTELLTPHLK